MENCPGFLINITAGPDFKMDEFEIITTEIGSKAGENGDIITGIIFDEELEGKIKVTLIATGLSAPSDTIYEIESMRQAPENQQEELSEMLNRIRTNDKSEKKQETKRAQKKPEGSLQMDIPAFMRKFSN